MKIAYNILRQIAFLGTLIMGLVGATMFLNPIIKLYILGFDRAPYDNAEMECNGLLIEPMPPKEASEADKYSMRMPYEQLKTQYGDYNNCLTKVEERYKKQYNRQQKNNMVDGFVVLFVGIAGMLITKIRRKKDMNTTS